MRQRSCAGVSHLNRLGVLAVLPGLLVACGSPTAPDTRVGFIGLRIVCDDSAVTALVCRAETYCAGLYRCPYCCGWRRFATVRATWSSGDPNIVRVTRPGVAEAVMPGTLCSSPICQAPVAPRGGPCRCFLEPRRCRPLKFSGPSGGGKNGRDGGTVRGDRARDERRRGGPHRDRRRSSATAAGYSGPVGGAGYYRLLGIPPGTYELQVTASGHLSEQRAVTVTTLGSPIANFQLRPQ